MTEQRHYRVYLPKLIGGLIILLMTALIVYWISSFIKDKPSSKKKQIQKITILKPPPPPPPPPKLEKPPEPEIEEQIDEPEPEPENLPDVSDEPPAGDLGLDAEGGAGSDGFGLVGRKGGRGLLSGDPKAWYSGIIKNQLTEVLSERDELRSRAYSAVVYFWLDLDGSVQRFEIRKATGLPDIDKILKAVLQQVGTINEAPPAGLKQPVRMKISSRI